VRLIIKLVKENPDGSGVCNVEYDSEALQLLIQYGLTSIMKEALENERLRSLQPFDAHNTWPFESKPKSPKKRAPKNEAK